ncbi:hypothetical protein LTI14_02145 [Nesterenkonia sp. YGD6]|uniref:hypothetical protein n=1 Tax=Nesterenkonia sp. YGD6 TaxID=2901231 RepID=UPI001F4C8338|nr:hypothetical protein [Nesterenkonia sp. YGD6]MCH8562026.1 hypothetical protein [Nesterenkonia sp. YGD6]
MTDTHGTYFAADGARAKFADALAEWVPIAHKILTEVASEYNRTITYLEITEAVQERSGIRTKRLITNWSGTLLESVAQRAADSGQPPLTALCVRQDGTIGDGYSKAPKSVPSDLGTNVEDLAAQHRLLCYKAYADDLPADGGAATLTPQVVKARSLKRTPAEKPRAICEIHYLEMSANGACGQCED